MKASLVYRNSWLYEAAMLLIYRRYYWARQKVIADLIPNSSVVLDVCCGPGLIYDRFLRRKDVQYTGIDLNERFLKRVRAVGGSALQLDLTSDSKLPACDVAIMQASLYQFLPDARAMVEQLRRSARRKIIVAEPIRNMANSPIGLLRWIALKQTNPGTGNLTQRFDEHSFRQLAESFGKDLEALFKLPGGREMCMVVRCHKE